MKKSLIREYQAGTSHKYRGFIHAIGVLKRKREFITKRCRRAREPSRISVPFLRRLKKKSSVLKKFLFKRISSILIPKFSKLHRYVKKVRKLYNTRYKCNHKHDPKIFLFIIKVTVPKKTSLLSLSSRLYHVLLYGNNSTPALIGC